MKEKINELYNLFFGKELGVLPGNLAYSFFMALIPLLTLIFFFLTQFNLPIDIIQNFLRETFPSGVVELVQPIFTDQITLSSLITLIIGLVISANGCQAIILASNTIFEVENASYLRRFIKSVILTFCIIFLFAFIVIVPLFGKSILALIGTFTDVLTKYETLISTIYVILQVPVSLIFVYFFIKLVYTIAPDENIPSKYMTKGAVFTTISWLLLTKLFSYYINNIAKYDLIYGNLANIVILLIWFYGLAYVFVIGLYLNKHNTEANIEKTNDIKLEEIRKKVKDTKESKK